VLQGLQVLRIGANRFAVSQGLLALRHLLKTRQLFRSSSVALWSARKCQKCIRGFVGNMVFVYAYRCIVVFVYAYRCVVVFVYACVLHRHAHHGVRCGQPGHSSSHPCLVTVCESQGAMHALVAPHSAVSVCVYVCVSLRSNAACSMWSTLACKE
jgi:hypothetical protein